jgi:RimJ/RimL family protein N-acetyltransferase
MAAMGMTSPQARLKQVAGTDHTRVFAIMMGTDLAGELRLSPHGPDCLLLTCDIAPDFLGRGVATSAVADACRRVAGREWATRLVAMVEVTAGAAQTALEANGFTCLNVRENPLLFERTWMDPPPE